MKPTIRELLIYIRLNANLSSAEKTRFIGIIKAFRGKCNKTTKEATNDPTH